MNFVEVCLNELYDNIESELRYNALSSRLSKLEDDDFSKFMSEIEPKKVNKISNIDHEAQIKQLLQG
jgi:ERCC4-related helicase